MTIIDGGCKKNYALSRPRDRRKNERIVKEASLLFREGLLEIL